MALSLSKKLATVMGDKKVSVYEITGDGSTKALKANNLQMAYVEYSYLVNKDDSTATYMSTAAGTSLTT